MSHPRPEVVRRYHGAFGDEEDLREVVPPDQSEPGPHRPTEADMRDVYARNAYEAAMLCAVARLQDGLDHVTQGTALVLSRTPEGRIYCRSIRIQEALREIDETVPPPHPGEGR